MNVRQRVKELVEFIQDDERLREERKKAKKNKDKYVGVSSDSMGYRNYCKSPLRGVTVTVESRQECWILTYTSFLSSGGQV